MSIDSRKLAQSWTHSHEEDSGDQMVFRPSSFHFPLSRGRRSIDLEAGGRLTESKPGPADRTQQAAGSWKLHGDRLLLRGPDGATLQYEVVSVDDHKLVLRQAATA